MPTLTRRRLLAHFRDADPVMAALIAAAGPFRLRVEDCPSPFRHLAKAIVSQQISGRAAAAILQRFIALFALDPQGDEFPHPLSVLQRGAADLRGAGLSAAKAAALRDLAEKTLEGVVPDTATLRTLDDDTIVERLTVVRGVGPWTVQMMLMFQLGRTDVLPLTDFGVRNGYRIAYRRRRLPTPGELRRHGESWAPYRSAAAWYLWRAVDLERERILWSRPERVRKPPPAPRGDVAGRPPRRGARTR